ncbi:MAG: hypothetical protein CVU47_11835 [Chloroflexi bacterium HGW-Chloroflexi-9]|nr:MAG: hypothetical protein CVU47_11835 [Chloroflexi bacterium HGW-Chloroflexi-9]
MSSWTVRTMPALAIPLLTSSATSSGRSCSTFTNINRARMATPTAGTARPAALATIVRATIEGPSNRPVTATTATPTTSETAPTAPR